MKELSKQVRMLFRPRFGVDAEAFKLLCSFSDSLFALTDGSGTVQSASHALQRLLNNSHIDSFRCFDQLLYESSHYEYHKSLDYIARENKPIMNMSVHTVLFSNDDSQLLKIIPLAAADEARLLLHIVTRKEASASTAHDLSRVEKLTNVGQIAAGIAHELNTPLGSIILSAGNIIESTETNDIAEEATRIKRRAEHCSTVVKELLGYVREADKERVANELLSIISTVTGLMTSELQKRDILLSVNSAVDQLTVLCNENQIEQVLFNLLNNAIHAIDRGGSIDISIQIDSLLERVHLVVKDDGTGISPENIDRVFDPFFTTKPGTQGTGIGLALCKKIILEHGGDIAVESTEGAGTTFNLWLPLRND